jgi:hypothetical protein
MASHSQGNPHTLSTHETSNSPRHKEEHVFPDIPYALHHEEFNQFRRITRSYAQQINVFPLALLLPQRKQISRIVVESPDQVFWHIVEDLIDFTLTEIEHTLNLIPETPVDNFSEPDDFSEEEGFNSECSVSGSEDMEDYNGHNEERGKFTSE